MHYPSPGEPTDLKYQYRYTYDDSNFVVYEGVAPANANEEDEVWIVKKYTNDGTNVSKIVFADGSSSFNKSWRDRESYSYK